MYAYVNERSRECLNSNPGSIVYLMCGAISFFKLAEPRFLSCKQGGPEDSRNVMKCL